MCLNLAATSLSMSSRRSLLTRHHRSTIVRGLRTCAATLSGPSHLLGSIAILGSLSGENFQEISIPALRVILEEAKDIRGRSISPVAVLLETALSEGCPVESTCKLIAMGADIACEGPTPGASLPGIIPVLSMLEQDDDRIRKAAVAFLKKIGHSFGNSKHWSTCAELSAMQWMYRDIFKDLDENQSYQSLGSILSSAAKGKNGTSTRGAFLRVCAFTSQAMTYAKAGMGALPSPASSPCTLEGVSTILRSMEVLGEVAFPLIERWEVVGGPFVEKILKESEISTIHSFGSLPYRVLSMLKGRYLVNETPIISGPRADGVGGRSRSYSLGSFKGARIIEPYAQQMQTALLTILKTQSPGGFRLSSAIITEILLDKAWVEHVFKRFEASTKVEIFKSIIELEEACSEKAASAFSQLPFDGHDVHGLLRHTLNTQPMNLPLIVGVLRFTAANPEAIGNSKAVAIVLEVLFDVLEKLASAREQYNEPDLEYTCQSLVSTMDVICRGSVLTAPPESAIKYFRLLLACQGVDSNHLFTTKKCSLSALKLTATLAENYPSHGLPALHDSFKAALENGFLVTLGSKHRVELFSQIRGVFWNQSTHFPFANLLQILAEYLDQMEKQHALVSDLVLAISKTYTTASIAKQHLCCPGALAAVMIAARENQSGCIGKFDAREVIRFAPRKAKMPSLALLFQYASNLVAEISIQQNAIKDIEDPLPSHKVVAAIIEEPNSTSNYAVLRFILHLVRTLQDCFQMSDVQKMISKGSGEDARCSLSLWQGSLWLRAVSDSVDCANPEEQELWVSIATCLGEIRDDLQLILPVTLFLASVSSLLEEDKRSSTLCQALSLVADRVLEIHVSSPEATLFLGLVPDLCAMLGEESWRQETTVPDQCALLAIEHIGRVVSGEEGETPDPNRVTPFVSAIDKIATVLGKGYHVVNFGKVAFEDIPQAQRDLVSSMALTLATLVRLVGVRSMPYLGVIFSPLMETLSSANKTIDNNISKETAGPRDMQMAILRALSSIAECVPQFLGLHIGKVMHGSLFLSRSIRNTKDPLMKQAMQNFDTAVSTKVPARVFVPSLAKAIASTPAVDELHILLQLLQMSVHTISSREAGALKSSVFSCVTTALELEATLKSDVRKQATDALVSFVLKLSENQLRRFYSALKEWKSEVDTEPIASNACRREAFWAFSAALAEQLQALFLPCLSQVVDDMVRELEHAVIVLSRTESLRSETGHKKQKLAASEVAYPNCSRNI